MNEHEPVTRPQVNAAIAWYRQHKVEIKAALPIKIPGVSFRAGWPDSIERQIKAWELGMCSLKLAEIYIYRELKQVALALKRAK